MSVFHVPSMSANDHQRAAGALARLCEHVDGCRTRPLVDEGFERVERELHERFVEAEREVLGELLERLDVDVPSVEIGERRYHRVLDSTETYTTAVGAVKVRRTLYRCGRERAVVPMELRAGMVEGHWTPLAARQASCVVAQMTPKEGETLLRELGNMAPSKSSLDRLPKALSARWEANREPFESTLRDVSVVPDEAVTVAVSLDGVMVPMKDGCRANKRERARGGPAHQRTGRISRGKLRDAVVLRCRGGAARHPVDGTHARAEEGDIEDDAQCRARRGAWETARPAHRHRRRRGARQLALSRCVGEATAVVDFYHATEHLKAALDARYGENNATGRAQFHKLRHVLRDDADGVPLSRKKFPRRTRSATDTSGGALRPHPDPACSDSGIVEAACKTLVTQRLKSGMGPY